MPAYLMLVSPGANRVYAGDAPRLATAELALTCPFAREISTVDLAGTEYVAFTTEAPPGGSEALGLARQSGRLALFEHLADGALRPLELPQAYWLPEDLVTIPKYQGKTNERFTHLLAHVTLAQARVEWPRPGTDGPGRPSVLDPLAGRGTTLLTAWRLGCDAYGVEADAGAFDALAAYLRTYLRRTRRHHKADTAPVRRDGRKLGHRFDARETDAGLGLTVFTGDTRDSAVLYGKRRFDANVTDAPYGVVHGARSGRHEGRDRSPAALLRQALPVWAGQLRPGGALGLAWNTYGLPRADLLDLIATCGLQPCTGGPWEELSHRVDSAIIRDLVVAVKP